MNIAIILSGGTGSRLGAETPKQYIRIGGKLLITYCLETLTGHPDIDALQIVAAPEWEADILADAENNGLDIGKIHGFSLPGQERQSSIWSALTDIAQDSELLADTVLIHDAARPNLSSEMISRCMEAIKGHEGVMPVLPMKDTIYVSEDGRKVFELVDRNRVFAGQAPELFCFTKYMEANRVLLPDKIGQIMGSTEPAVMAGMDIIMIPGDERNFKVTTQDDLERFKSSMEG